jgi:hypothetical protein
MNPCKLVLDKKESQNPCNSNASFPTLTHAHAMLHNSIDDGSIGEVGLLSGRSVHYETL